MINMCKCPELNYMYVSDDDESEGIECYIYNNGAEVSININAFYDYSSAIESVRIPIKCCPFCGKNFSE